MSIILSLGNGTENDKMEVGEKITQICANENHNCNYVQKGTMSIPFNQSIPAAEIINDDVDNIEYTDITADELREQYYLTTNNRLLDPTYRTSKKASVGAFDYKMHANESKKVIFKDIYEVCEISKISKTPNEPKDVDGGVVTHSVIASRYFQKNGATTTQQWLENVCVQEENCVSNEYDYVISCGQKHQDTGDDLVGINNWVDHPDEIAWRDNKAHSLLPGYSNGYIPTGDTSSVSYTVDGYNRIISGAKYGGDEARKMIAQSRLIDVFVLRHD